MGGVAASLHQMDPARWVKKLAFALRPQVELVWAARAASDSCLTCLFHVLFSMVGSLSFCLIELNALPEK